LLLKSVADLQELTPFFHCLRTQQALVLTNAIVQSSLQSLRQHLDVLFAFAESMALLDMLASFAETVAFADTPFSRPLLTEDEPVRLPSTGCPRNDLPSPPPAHSW
jgi:hypothetical protein